MTESKIKFEYVGLENSKKPGQMFPMDIYLGIKNKILPSDLKRFEVHQKEKHFLLDFYVFGEMNPV